jgi:endonuclease III
MAREVTASELNIDVGKGEGELFKWFLASFLFGKRIQQEIAVEAYRVIVEKYKRDTPRKLCNCSWQELVDMLGEGHYVRYDESTAERLLKLCEKLNKEYGGKIGSIHRASENRKDFEKHLREFEGIGPKTVEIFMREAGKIWYD